MEALLEGVHEADVPLPPVGGTGLPEAQNLVVYRAYREPPKYLLLVFFELVTYLSDTPKMRLRDYYDPVPRLQHPPQEVYGRFENLWDDVVGGREHEVSLPLVEPPPDLLRVETPVLPLLR